MFKTMAERDKSGIKMNTEIEVRIRKDENITNAVILCRKNGIKKRCTMRRSVYEKEKKL